MIGRTEGCHNVVGKWLREGWKSVDSLLPLWSKQRRKCGTPVLADCPTVSGRPVTGGGEIWQTAEAVFPSSRNRVGIGEADTQSLPLPFSWCNVENSSIMQMQRTDRWVHMCSRGAPTASVTVICLNFIPSRRIGFSSSGDLKFKSRLLTKCKTTLGTFDKKKLRRKNIHICRITAVLSNRKRSRQSVFLAVEKNKCLIHLWHLHNTSPGFTPYHQEIKLLISPPTILTETVDVACKAMEPMKKNDWIFL